jgi:hypothetical protein
VKHKQCTYGVDALCKECNRAASRKWYARNEAKAREAMKAYAEANWEKIKEYKRIWQQENKERYYENHARWRSRAENRKKVNEIGRRWREANRQRQADNVKNWRLANPERSRVNLRNRRARKRNAPGKHTVADVERQYEFQRGMCYWCSEPLNGKFHGDHIMPLIKGGSNYPENIVCTCETCNCAKGDRLVYSEWQPPNPLFPDNPLNETIN